MTGSAAAPRIAVLITYYNEGKLLSECIDSVARQAGAPDELLVYDDASGDPAERYIPPGTRVRIIRGESNLGPAHGRNTLLRSTTCEFVHFHDADDLFAPEWARKVRERVARNDVDIVLTDVTSVRDGVVASASVMNLAEGLRADPDLVRFGLRGALLLPSSTSRRSLALSIGGFRTREILRQSEDFDFHLRLAAAAGNRYVVIPESLVIQRLRSGSHSSDTRAVWVSAAESLRSLGTELPARYRQDLSDASARIASRLFEIGASIEARATAAHARKLGRPRFPNRPFAYRVAAAVLGQAAAEGIGRAYRRVLPDRFRRSLDA